MSRASNYRNCIECGRRVNNGSLRCPICSSSELSLVEVLQTAVLYMEYYAAEHPGNKEYAREMNRKINLLQYHIKELCK